MTAMKVIFLDIDGVLNSERSLAAFGHRPWSLTPFNWHFFDGVAVRLLARAASETSASVVLSSSWRTDLTTSEDRARLGAYLKVDIIGATPTAIQGPWGELMGSPKRGDQIEAWLAAHPEVEDWAIVDDVDEVLPSQAKRLVLVDGDVGFSVANMLLLKRILTRRELPAPAEEFKPIDDAHRLFLLGRENKLLRQAAREFARTLENQCGVRRDAELFPELEEAFQAIES